MLSIIIPFQQQEKNQALELAFKIYNFDFKNLEILLIGNELRENKKDAFSFIQSEKKLRHERLNIGIENAKYEYLWFVHVDSLVKKDHIKALLGSIPFKGVRYFDLKFHDHLTLGARAIELGCLFRCNMFSLPFGDQGMCFSKNLGKFPEVVIGEDFEFILKQKKGGELIKSLEIPLLTSGRKYVLNGTLKTALLHLSFTYGKLFSFWWQKFL